MRVIYGVITRIESCFRVCMCDKRPLYIGIIVEGARRTNDPEKGRTNSEIDNIRWGGEGWRAG